MNLKKIFLCLLLAVLTFYICPGFSLASMDSMLASQTGIYERHYQESARIIRELLRLNLITPEMASEMLNNIDKWAELARGAGVGYGEADALIERFLQEQEYITEEQRKEIEGTIYGPLSEMKVTGVRLDKRNLILPLGYKETITATVYPTNAINKDVYWITEDPLVVNIEGQGRSVKVIAMSPGTVKVTVVTRDGQFRTHCLVEAIVLIRSLSVKPDQIELNIGDDADLAVTIMPDDAGDKSITWTSTNPAAVSVDQAGKVKALSPGESRIVARSVQDEMIASYCTVTVRDEAYLPDNNYSDNNDSKTLTAQLIGSLAAAVIIIMTGIFFVARSKKNQIK